MNSFIHMNYFIQKMNYYINEIMVRKINKKKKKKKKKK